LYLKIRKIPKFFEKSRFLTPRYHIYSNLSLEKRVDLLRDLRRERIPSWKEEERVEKVKVQVAKVMVNAEILDLGMDEDYEIIMK